MIGPKFLDTVQYGYGDDYTRKRVIQIPGLTMYYAVFKFIIVTWYVMTNKYAILHHLHAFNINFGQ